MNIFGIILFLMLVMYVAKTWRIKEQRNTKLDRIQRRIREKEAASQKAAESQESE